MDTSQRHSASAMGQEMAEQPEVLRRLLEARAEIHDVVREAVPRPFSGIALLGRGSSENALVCARYVLEIATRKPATFVAPSVASVYGVEVDYGGHLALCMSQSGQTPEIVEATRRLRESGAATIAVTADTTSPVAAAAATTVDLRTGAERAVPATKTFTAQLAVAAMTGEALSDGIPSEASWEALPDAVDEVLHDAAPVRDIAPRLAAADSVVAIGRGMLFSVAREAALKLDEAAGLIVSSHPAAAFRHGPIAWTRQGRAVLAFYVGGRAGEEMDALTNALRQRGADVVTIAASEDADLRFPTGLPETLAVVPAAVRAQQLALSVAQLRGRDPDAPPDLGKVTHT